MIHVPPFPGSSSSSRPMTDVLEWCVRDAANLVANGFTGLVVENYWDTPFAKGRVDPHVVSALTVVVQTLRDEFPDVQLGVNVLRNDAHSSLAIATITGSQFIRVNVLSYARLTDQGIIEGVGYELSRYKHLLGSTAEVWADVDVKHSVGLAPVPVAEQVADQLHRGGASKVIFSGAHTGDQTDLGVVQSLVEDGILNPDQAVVGSGTTVDNVGQFLPYARHFIVGTSLKEDGLTHKPVDPHRAKALVEAYEAAT